MAGDVPFDYMVAPVVTCVALTTMIRVNETQVESLGYYYTCATRN